ncbi:hypothetical protein FE391_17435 [Nonomuraea sp. KC401]|uniref:hypothetical protein n=1 Tax=unclassified Nonomuraea TaxID=2593643 RepID=UPI0010FED563|nr:MULTISPECIES: hypothetical protein [unclassified Nonomuraea]NBE95338.1 hypothetical protein [Nonomuraea sp. K271]TLF72177.1 hypothetical protein FE391_17435 [Nonomuraea sp. KC401]
MRVVYRGLAVAAAVVAAAVTMVVVVLPSGPDEVAAGPVTAPPAAPSSSGPAPSPTGSATSPTVGEPAPAAKASATAGPTPGASLAPGYTAMDALYADPRVPKLTAKVKGVKERASARRVMRDRRTGLAVPRLGRPWKAHNAAPFTTKQVLPRKRGTSPRGIVVTCPLPIMKQKSPRDTALLAARWTLNHHPEGSRITWLATQRVKRGWTLIYQVTYGKRSSRAAVVVMDGGMSKPGLTFVTVPDTQRKHWPEVGRVATGVRVLG